MTLQIPDQPIKVVVHKFQISKTTHKAFNIFIRVTQQNKNRQQTQEGNGTLRIQVRIPTQLVREVVAVLNPNRY